MYLKPWGLLEMAGLLIGASLVVLSGVPSSLAAVPGEVYGGDDDACQVGETVSFDSGSTVVNLAAQAKLNEVLQWVMEAPGRRVLVLGANGPRPEDVRLGAVRASAAALFLINGGANSTLVSRSDFGELQPKRLVARTDVDSVVLMTCDVTEPLP
jgi:outer membrane protein OmpA-like peptidoglycan-associated protein